MHATAPSLKDSDFTVLLNRKMQQIHILETEIIKCLEYLHNECLKHLIESWSKSELNCMSRQSVSKEPVNAQE